MSDSVLIRACGRNRGAHSRPAAAPRALPVASQVRGVADVFTGEQCLLCGWHLRAAHDGSCPICLADFAVLERAEREGGAR